MSYYIYLSFLFFATPPSDYDYYRYNKNTSDLSYLRNICDKVSIELELVDPRESRYLFAKDEDFYADFRMVQRRYFELYDAPSSFEGFKFPNKDSCYEAMTFNRRYKKHLEDKLEFATTSLQRYEIEEVIEETDKLYKIWDLLHDVNTEYYYVSMRRRALKELKIELGDSAFYDGAMPPHVPLWRFNRIH